MLDWGHSHHERLAAGRGFPRIYADERGLLGLGACGMFPRHFSPPHLLVPRWGFLDRCRSSVVEHPLGKGEVRSSILRGSTITNQ